MPVWTLLVLWQKACHEINANLPFRMGSTHPPAGCRCCCNTICVNNCAKILTDYGSHFLSDLFKNIGWLLRIKKIQIKTIHPESNGSLERSHWVLTEHLPCYVRRCKNHWNECIPYAVRIRLRIRLLSAPHLSYCRVSYHPSHPLHRKSLAHCKTTKYT